MTELTEMLENIDNELMSIDMLAAIEAFLINPHDEELMMDVSEAFAEMDHEGHSLAIRYVEKRLQQELEFIDNACIDQLNNEMLVINQAIVQLKIWFAPIYHPLVSELIMRWIVREDDAGEFIHGTLYDHIATPDDSGYSFQLVQDQLIYRLLMLHVCLQFNKEADDIVHKLFELIQSGEIQAASDTLSQVDDHISWRLVNVATRFCIEELRSLGYDWTIFSTRDHLSQWVSSKMALEDHVQVMVNDHVVHTVLYGYLKQGMMISGQEEHPIVRMIQAHVDTEHQGEALVDFDADQEFDKFVSNFPYIHVLIVLTIVTYVREQRALEQA